MHDIIAMSQPDSRHHAADKQPKYPDNGVNVPVSAHHQGVGARQHQDADVLVEILLGNGVASAH